jgi:hypothetical protein
LPEIEPTPRPVGVHQIAPPSDLVAKTTLSDVSHRDCFIVDIDPSVSDRSAEEWARAIFEDAPAPTRDRLTTGWPLLGLQLGPLTSDKHVLGWTILTNSPDQVLLFADGSSGIVAELLIERPVRVPVVIIARVEAGLLAHERLYWDRQQVLDQIR